MRPRWSLWLLSTLFIVFSQVHQVESSPPFAATKDETNSSMRLCLYGYLHRNV